MVAVRHIEFVVKIKCGSV